jgi:asparagine N-glycosylation enzyme membrane subunit Stt3
VYFAIVAIYYALVLAVIIDVLRQPPTLLSGLGKAVWVVAFLLVPVLPWLVYGFWRIKTSRL